MAQILKQSTAVDVIIGPFVDSTNGDTEETGLTISRADVLLSKNGQALTQKTDVTAAAHDANGMYNCELDATDTDTIGQLTIFVHESGALAVRHDYQVVEQDTYEFLFASGSTADADVAAILADTNEVQAELADGGRLDLLIDLILADTGELQAEWVDGGRLDLLIDLILADTGELQAEWVDAGRLDLILDAILADTTGLNGDAMRGTDSAALASVLGALNDAAAAGDPTATDTLVQYAKQLINVLVGATGVATFPAAGAPANNISLAEIIRAIYDDTNAIQGKLPSGTISDFAEASNDVTLADASITAAKYAANAREAAGQATDEVNAIADGVWNEARSGHTIAGTYGEVHNEIISGAAEAGTLSTTEMTSDLSEATDEHYNGRIVIWTGGVLSGQASDITAYLGSTGRLTYTAVTEAPSAADTFIIV